MQGACANHALATGISFTASPTDRRRLDAVVRDHNTAQKHVWRATIILLSAAGVGTTEIMRRTGKSKTCVWRWQERFMEEGVDGLLRDKTRPSRIPPLGPEVAERVVALTLTDPPGEVIRWTASMMATAAGISESAVSSIPSSTSRPPSTASSQKPMTTRNPSPGLPIPMRLSLQSNVGTKR